LYGLTKGGICNVVDDNVEDVVKMWIDKNSQINPMTKAKEHK
jgi:hypothetical protein